MDEFVDEFPDFRNEPITAQVLSNSKLLYYLKERLLRMNPRLPLNPRIRWQIGEQSHTKAMNSHSAQVIFPIERILDFYFLTL